ncbi:MAG: DUF29 domain-containing protein [Magnetospirillum sp.]|nr:DUF29 domain-containing protein [Magnetospirillum sp.]
MPAPLHDADFFRWTEEQAAALRSMPRSNVLDSDNLAEEIEDMGRAELNKVASLLTQVLTHLLKLAIDPAAPAREHWVDEILAFQADARRAFSPGMRERLEIAELWYDAVRRAAAALAEAGRPEVVLPAHCPLDLDTLLRRDFDYRQAALAVVAALPSPTSH